MNLVDSLVQSTIDSLRNVLFEHTPEFDRGFHLNTFKLFYMVNKCRAIKSCRKNYYVMTTLNKMLKFTKFYQTRLNCKQMALFHCSLVIITE